jgi:DNA mismatch repair protein MutS
LQVGALAGLPKPVIAQARRILDALERKHAVDANQSMADPRASSPQLALFAPAQPSAAERALLDLDPDAMTPKEALEALYRLKSLVR